MRYREYAPLPQLAMAVERVWTLEGQAAPGGAPDAVLPDGRSELVVHLGDPFDLIDEAGAAVRQPAVIYAGQLASRLLLRPTGRIAVLGVRFHPHGATSLFSMPQHELIGPPLGVDDLRPTLKREIAAVAEHSHGLEEAAIAVQRVLLNAIDVSRLDDRVRFAVRVIAQARGRVSIDRVAAAANITRRHLERRFLNHVGVTPKRLARITRFQHALQILEHADEASRTGARTAAECGYADQAHFVRDFRSLAGCSPSQHLLRRAELTGVFISRG